MEFGDLLNLFKNRNQEKMGSCFLCAWLCDD